MTLREKFSGGRRTLIRATSACLAIAACAIDERPELTGAPGAGGRPAADAPRGEAGEDPAGSEQNDGAEARAADGGGAPEYEGGSPSSVEGGGGKSGPAGKGGAGNVAGAASRGGSTGAAGRAGSAGRGGSSGSGVGTSGSSGNAGVAGAGAAGVAGAGTAAASCGDGKVEGAEECDPYTGLGATPGHALNGSVECTYDCRLVSRDVCWTCEVTSCPEGRDSPDENGNCLLEQLPGGALDTASEREACQDLSACFWAKHCAYDAPTGTPNPLRCFCGSKEHSKCAEWSDGTADGLCAREIERAFGTTSTATILEKWRDTTYSAAGTAINRLYCDTGPCAEQCAP